MNNRKFACGVTASSINLIAELEDESDQSFLHVIDTDGTNDEIKIDQLRANFLKNRKSNPQKVNYETVKQSEEDENNEVGFKDLYKENDIFLEQNSEQVNDIDHLKGKNKMHSTPVINPFEKSIENFENMSYGSKTVQEFAKKLSERLKFLKPIK